MIRVRIVCKNRQGDVVRSEVVDFWNDFEKVLEEVYERMQSWNIKQITLEKVAGRR